jgi:hypothetical protein
VTLVLLVLAGIWAAVLIPPAVRARAEGRPGDSISNFRRQLTVLRRTGPQVGRAGAGEPRHRFHNAAAPVLPVHGPLRSTSTRPATRSPHAAAVRAGTPASAARSRTIRRRRDVLTALLVAVVATLLLGVFLGSGLVWGVHLLADVLLVAYVALLVHQRNVAAERDMKVRYFPQAPRLDPAMLRAEPALLRRSAN